MSALTKEKSSPYDEALRMLRRLVPRGGAHNASNEEQGLLCLLMSECRTGESPDVQRRDATEAGNVGGF